jgi:hypothetical protein
MSDEVMHRRGAGGTEGGIGAFLLGVAMASAGAYLVTSRVVVSTGGFRLWGVSSFGLSLIPLLAGIALLFFNGRNPLGWLLSLAGISIIFAGILLNLDVYFQPTSLFNTLMMLGLLMGGIGLIARSLLPWR